MASSDFQSNEGRELKLRQSPFVGYIAWLVQRITAVILLVLLPLKIYSGYAITGKLPGAGFFPSLHLNAVLDAFLIFALIFHALYGVRVILIDMGIVKDNRNIFKIFTIIGGVSCALLFFFIVS